MTATIMREHSSSRFGFPVETRPSFRMVVEVGVSLSVI